MRIDRYDEQGKELQQFELGTDTTRRRSTFEELDANMKAQQDSVAMQQEANNMLAEKEAEMKAQEAIDNNKKLNPELIAKMSQQDKSTDDFGYTSAGQAQSPRYLAGDLGEGFNVASPQVQQEMLQSDARSRFGDTSIPKTLDYDIFDAEGNMITNKRKGTIGGIIAEGLSDLGYKEARAIIGGLLVADETFGEPTAEDINIRLRKLAQFNDEQLANHFYNQSVYVRNNNDGTYEKKTYGDIASDLEKGATDIIKGLPENILIGIGTIMTGGLLGAAGSVGYYGSTTFSDEYGKLRSEGYSKDDAFNASAVKAGGDAILETAGIKAVSKIPGVKHFAGKLGRTMLGQAGAEGLTEVAQGVKDDLVDKYMLDKDVEVGSHALSDLAGGMVSGPIVGGLGSRARRGVDKVNSRVYGESTTKNDTDTKVEPEQKVEPKVAEVKVEPEVEAETNESPWIDRLNPNDPYFQNEYNKDTGEFRRVGTGESNVETTQANDEAKSTTEVSDTESTATAELKRMLETASPALKEYAKLRDAKVPKKSIDKALRTGENANVPAEYGKLLELRRKATGSDIETIKSKVEPKVEDKVESVNVEPKAMPKPVVSKEAGTHKSTDGSGREYSNEWSSDNFTARHYPDRQATSIKGKDGRWYPFKQSTQSFDRMVAKNKGIGEWYNSTARTAEALTDNIDTEQELGGTRLNRATKDHIKKFDSLAELGRLTKGRMLTKDAKDILKTTKTRVIGNLITSAKQSDKYSDKDVAALSEYYDKNYDKNHKLNLPEAKKSDSKKKDDDDFTPPSPKSEKDVRDNVHAINKKANSSKPWLNAKEMKQDLDTLVSMTKSKFYNAKSNMATTVKRAYNKIVTLAKKLGGEFAETINSYILDPKNNMVMAFMPTDGGRTIEEFTQAKVADEKREKTVQNNELDKANEKQSKKVTYSKVLDDNIENIDNIVNDDVVFSKLYPKEAGLLKSLQILEQDNFNVNLRNFDNTFDSEVMDDNIQNIVDALGTGNHTAITKALMEAKKDNSDRANEKLKSDIKKMHEETKALRKTKFFSKLNIKIAGKDLAFANPLFLAQHATKLAGDTFYNYTWKAINDANRAKQYIENSFMKSTVDFVKENNKELTEAFKKHTDLKLNDVIKGSVYKFKNLQTKKRVDDVEISMDTMLLIDNADFDESSTGDYHVRIPYKDGSIQITLSESQLDDISDYVDNAKKSDPIIGKYESTLVESFKNVVNAHNASSALNNSSGVGKMRYLTKLVPIPFGKYGVAFSDDAKIDDKSGKAKSFANSYDGSKMDAKDRVYNITTITQQHANLSRAVANLVAKENTISKLSSLRGDMQIKDMMKEAYGEKMYKNIDDWMGIQIDNYNNFSDGIDGIPTSKIGKALKSRISKTLLTFKAGTVAKQAPSAVVAVPYISEEWDVNEIKAGAKLAENLVYSHARKAKNLAYQASHKLENDATNKLRNRIWNMYDPQLLARLNQGANYEMRQLNKDTESRITDIGKPKSTAAKIVDAPGKVADIGMQPLSVEDNVIIDAIWNTNLHYGLQNASGKVDKAVSDYITALNSASGLNSDIIDNMNKYLDKQVDGDVSLFKDVSDINTYVVASSQPGTEGHNMMNDKHSVDAIAQIRSFMSSARDPFTSSVKLRNAQLHMAVAGGDADEIKDAFRKWVGIRIAVLMSSAGVAGVTGMYNYLVKPETEFYQDGTNFAQKSIDVYMDNNIMTSVANKAVNAITRDSKGFDIISNQVPATLMLENMNKITMRVAAKINKGKDLSAKDKFDMINIGLSATYGLNLNAFIDVFDGITSETKSKIRDELSNIDADNPIEVQDAKIKVLNELIKGANDKDKKEYKRYKRSVKNIKSSMERRAKSK